MLHPRVPRTPRGARSPEPPVRRRLPGAMLAAALTTLIAVPVGALPAPSPAAAADELDATRFGGVNWAAPGDNFVDGPVVPEGLEESDSYATVRAKADAVYSGFESTVGANTVRLPVNTYSVPGTAWGDAYFGAVDAATDRGMQVILSYWEDGASSGGRVVDEAAFYSMWDAVVDEYGSDDLVYFESMNEPHGYSASEWADFAIDWVERYPSLPRDRIIVSGSGYNGEVVSVCGDSRLDGTYVALHLYAFQFDSMSYDEWIDLFRSRIGDCGTRTVLDEFGAPMDDGLDYNDPDSSDNFVRYIRAATDTVHDLGMGAVYWPALGGKHTVRPDHDWYSLYALHGSGTDLSLSVRNQTGIDRLEYAFGLGDDTPGTGLENVGVPGCLDVPGGTRENRTQVQVWDCNGGSNQQWTRTSTGEITVYGGEKCLDALGGGAADGTRVGIYDCNGQDNQKWAFHSDNTLRSVSSGLCLDVSRDTSRAQLWSCWGGDNQQWQVVRN
ncbi:ricin-type beta-trefoil lectin domain protein [Nocardiopsis valliformis]|uniref:ricin-type beta-trefoil lectin domain protein n=1 Tax=Nocardiopsis valliformis TaxID=239974 RepID=UPI0003469735|nr:ricin-type beta-trefoil lectin domain protein [Nocardiopsis valliformis]